MQEQEAEPAAKPKRMRRAKTAPAELAVAEGMAADNAEEAEEAPKKKRRGKGPDPNAFGENLPFEALLLSLWRTKVQAV